MSRMFYLLNLRVDGIKNIEKPLDFEFYKKTINKNFNPEDYKIKAIYGLIFQKPGKNDYLP